MRLDLNQYRVNKPVIEAWIKRKPDEDPLDLIGSMAVATNCHILVICHYVGEIVGFSDRLNGMIERFKTFYDIGEITGVQNEKIDNA